MCKKKKKQRKKKKEENEKLKESEYEKRQDSPAMSSLHFQAILGVWELM